MALINSLGVNLILNSVNMRGKFNYATTAAQYVGGQALVHVAGTLHCK